MPRPGPLQEAAVCQPQVVGDRERCQCPLVHAGHPGRVALGLCRAPGVRHGGTAAGLRWQLHRPGMRIVMGRLASLPAAWTWPSRGLRTARVGLQAAANPESGHSNLPALEVSSTQSHAKCNRWP